MCLGNTSHIFFWHQAISSHFPRWPPKKLVNRWLDCIQIWYGCSIGISDDLINFWDGSIKKWLKSLWARQLMNRYLDCIQIWHGCYLAISDDLINFWDESIETKWPLQPFKEMTWC